MAGAVFLSSTVAAHLGSKKYLRVEVLDDGAAVEVEIDAIDASFELGMGSELDVDAVMVRGPLLRAWLEREIKRRRGTTRCGASATGPETVERDGSPYLLFEVNYECTGDGPMRLEDQTVFPDDAQHEAIVRIAYANEQDAEVLRQGRQEISLEGPAGAASLAGVFLWEGILHFVTGYDHILFLLSLVLAAGFISRKDGLRRALRDIVWLVTAFTLGHSVTLIAAALGVVALPSRPVEITIAASIIVVALLNIFRPEQRGPMPWLAFGFGLIHGFGFSSVLAEVGLPRTQTVLSLVSFNIGIELAQLAFVALAVGPIAYIARTPHYRRVVQGGSIVIGLLAAFWMVERILG